MYYNNPPLMLVNCSSCRTPLQLPHGARSIRWAICLPLPTSLTLAPPLPRLNHLLLPPSPSPYNHAPPGAPPHAHGRKRVVICGISYRYPRHELKGYINDTKCMCYLRINKFKFPEDSILMLTGNFFFFLYNIIV